MSTELCEPVVTLSRKAERGNGMQIHASLGQSHVWETDSFLVKLAELPAGGGKTWGGLGSCFRMTGFSNHTKRGDWR